MNTSYFVFTDAEGIDHWTLDPISERRENIGELMMLMDLTEEEWIRLEDLVYSEDEENLTIAEEIIYQKIE